jgi:hypothetical protein
MVPVRVEVTVKIAMPSAFVFALPGEIVTPPPPPDKVTVFPGTGTLVDVRSVTVTVDV